MYGMLLEAIQYHIQVCDLFLWLNSLYFTKKFSWNMVKNYGRKFLKCLIVNTQCSIPIRFIQTIWCWSLVRRAPKLLAEVTKSLSVTLESVSFDSPPNLGTKNHFRAIKLQISEKQFQIRRNCQSDRSLLYRVSGKRGQHSSSVFLYLSENEESFHVFNCNR